jgi:glycerol kinase
MADKKTGYTLALDQGTTSSRTIVFNDTLKPVAVSQQEFTQHFPASGWVEHDPHDLVNTIVATVRGAMTSAGISPGDVAGIGITNQRETTIIWDRATGVPLSRALVWQDRRTAEFCRQLEEAGHGGMITAKTGLLLDPYFSASKIAYILDTVPGARKTADAGGLAFGTVDTWLIWSLTGGKVHATDATNASRTMLYNIHDGDWDASLLELFRIPRSLLPEVKNCIDDFGTTDPKFFGGSIPICGVAGDQQAAAIGQACFEPGMMKSTYGTGCFALLNTGEVAVASRNKLLTTIAYQFDGKAHYALEGSIFIAGAVVQWLRDGLKIIKKASDSGKLALKAGDDEVVLVPAFTGLGAPYWKPECRGAVYGLSRDTGPEDFARAALKSVAFQTRDLLDAMLADWDAAVGGDISPLIRVDGGMAASDQVVQMIADITGFDADRPEFVETTALGAAWLAGAKAGLYPGQDGIGKLWTLDRRFAPGIDADQRNRQYRRWQAAVRATITASEVN